MKWIVITPKTDEFKLWARKELRQPHRDPRNLITIQWVGPEIFIHHPRLHRSNDPTLKAEAKENAESNCQKQWPQWELNEDYEVRVE